MEPIFKERDFMKSIRFRLVVAVLAVMLGAAIAKSQTADATAPVHGHAFGMRSPMMGFFARYLDLSDAQRAQMKAVLQKEHAAMKPQMQQLHQMQQELKQFEEGTYDEAKVQALVAQQAQTLVQLKVQETRIHNELFQLLTADQQAKMKEFEANREARVQQRMQNAPPAPQE
jgi:Spy/CpxP family protein refolding chaperone